MKIGVASDHRGWELKQEIISFLKTKGYIVFDYGTMSSQVVAYPDYGILLGEAVIKKEVDFGIAFCATGIGISIACNKVKGIRCAKVDTEAEATQARAHLDAQIIALNSSKETDLIKTIVLKFLTTKFSNLKRHQVRLQKIKQYEGEIEP